MAPKVNCNAQKLASIHTWMQKSRAVWSIKELDKQLLSVASINQMQVKDYIQNLQDDNKITCEKIGAGNWYWSFPSDQKKTAIKALAAAQEEHDKFSTTVHDLRAKLSERTSELEKEEDATDHDPTESRESLTSRHFILDSDVKALQKELAGYSDSDPTELERKKVDGKKAYEEAMQITEDIEVLDGVLKRQGVDEQMLSVQRMDYGEEWDTENFEFVELVWEE